MKSSFKIFIALIFSIQSFCLISQETGFEINIVDDSLNILIPKFLNKPNEGYIGLVSKAPLFDDLKYYTYYLYSVNENGDTTSVSFAKEDSICVYYGERTSTWLARTAPTLDS